MYLFSFKTQQMSHRIGEIALKLHLSYILLSVNCQKYFGLLVLYNHDCI